MRRAIDLAYAVRRRAMALLGWRTRGVKVMLFDRDGRLLIRNRYGRSDPWVLPGGGVGRGEASVASAVREVFEETGCRLIDPIAIGVMRSGSEGRRDTVHLFRGTTLDGTTLDGRPVPDGIEVADARFFAFDALPAGVSPATMRRIGKYRGRKPTSGVW